MSRSSLVAILTLSVACWAILAVAAAALARLLAAY